jgi:hypothetical protein
MSEHMIHGLLMTQNPFSPGTDGIGDRTDVLLRQGGDLLNDFCRGFTHAASLPA